jgi:hypothetical protein
MWRYEIVGKLVFEIRADDAPLAEAIARAGRISRARREVCSDDAKRIRKAGAGNPPPANEPGE